MMNGNRKKKYGTLILLIIYPYTFTLFLAIGIALNQIQSTVDFRFADFLKFTPLLYPVMLGLVIHKSVKMLKDDFYTSRDMVHMNTIIKCIQIPAYVLNFVLGVALFFTAILIPIVLVVILFDVASISLSGLYSVFCLLKAKKEGRLSAGSAMLFGVLHFIFCIDVIAAIVLAVTQNKKDAQIGGN